MTVAPDIFNHTRAHPRNLSRNKFPLLASPLLAVLLLSPDKRNPGFDPLSTTRDGTKWHNP